VKGGLFLMRHLDRTGEILQFSYITKDFSASPRNDNAMIAPLLFYRL